MVQNKIFKRIHISIWCIQLFYHFPVRFLSNASKDVDLRKWAAEGLAYLTLDAEVKQDLVEDNNAINSLIDLAKVSYFSSLMSAKRGSMDLTLTVIIILKKCVVNSFISWSICTCSDPKLAYYHGNCGS